VSVMPALFNAVAATPEGVQHMSCCPFRAKARQASLRRPRRRPTATGAALCSLCDSTSKRSSACTSAIHILIICRQQAWFIKSSD
jgi:hypothetical protein